jgi:prepilin-type N-terminal cleavage/methylation domain-containing protein
VTVRLRAQHGFTFVELMITLVFLSIALLAITSQFPLGLRASEQAEDITVETNLAQELLEEIRFLTWNPSVDEFVSGGYDGSVENPPVDLSHNPMDGTGGRPDYSRFRRTVRSWYLDPATLDTTATPTDLRRVQVVVVNIMSEQRVALELIVSKSR